LMRLFPRLVRATERLQMAPFRAQVPSPQDNFPSSGILNRSRITRALAVQKVSDQFSPTSVHAIAVEPVLARGGCCINDIKAPAFWLHDPPVACGVTSGWGFHRASLLAHFLSV
jgi:hypothetical protein